MALVVWPNSILRPRDMNLFLRHFSRSGGTSLNGQEQIIGTPASRWEMTITVGKEFDGAKLKEFEALVSRMRGRSNVARIVVCDPYSYGEYVSPGQEAWSDDAFFSDGTGWLTGGVQTMVVAAAVAIGAETLRTVLTNPKRPQYRIGDYFRAGNGLYRVETVDGAEIGFGPPLRSAIPAGTALESSPVQSYWRFATDGEGQRQREFMRWGGECTLTFHEAF